MRRERAPQTGCAPAHADEALDLLLGSPHTLHRALVDLLELLLEAVEGRGVLVEDPLEQGGDERRTVHLPGGARAGRELGELVQHGDRPVVGGDDPVVRDQAFDLRQLVRPVSARRVDRQVHESAGVAEARRLRRGGQAARCDLVQVELRRHGPRGVLRRLGNVDPQELRAAQAGRQVVDAREPLGSITVEQENARLPVVRRERRSIAPGSRIPRCGRVAPRRTDHASTVYPFPARFMRYGASCPSPAPPPRPGPRRGSRAASRA